MTTDTTAASPEGVPDTSTDAAAKARRLLDALDRMPLDERAAVATEVVGLLLGRRVDLSRSPASASTTTDTDSTDTHEGPTP